MNPSLAEALRHCDLQPGQTYRETINGRTVEVRVLDDDPTPELASISTDGLFGPRGWPKSR